MASRMASEIWSHILSGWPSVTDSEVNRYCAASTMLMVRDRLARRGRPRRSVPRRPVRRPVRTASRSRSRSIATQDLVADDAVVAQPDDGLALGVEDGGPDRLVVEQLLLGFVGRLVGAAARRGSPRARSASAAGRRARGGPGYSSASSSRRSQRGLDGGLARVRPPRVSAPVAATTPSRRTSHGSVRPWPTSVARMTQNVRKMIRSRSGKSVSGSARAAASETTPRIPAQETTKTARGGGDGSRARIFALSQPRQVGRREDPHDPGDDDRQADRDARPISSAARRPRQVGEDRRQLQPDEHERERR